jgi:hypothetical protein
MSRPLELDPVLVRPLRRPEKPPRRREKPAVKARPVVIRLAVAIVVVAATAAFAGRLGGLAIGPVLATHRTGLEIQELQQAKAREAGVNAQLREDILYLRTPAGIEQEARRRGWVRPGEVALAIVAPEPAEGAEGKPAEAPPPAAEPEPQSWADRIRSAVDTCLAVLGGGRKRE